MKNNLTVTGALRKALENINRPIDPIEMVYSDSRKGNAVGVKFCTMFFTDDEIFQIETIMARLGFKKKYIRENRSEYGYRCYHGTRFCYFR